VPDVTNREGNMRHLAAFVGVVVVAALGAGASTAAPAEQIHISINDTFVDDFWSEQCGFTVTFNFTADVHVTLVRNQEGLIVREIDRAGGGRITYSSDNGSFSFPAAPSQYDYGSGAVIGSSVVVSFPGLQGHVPGLIATDAGLVRLEGVVVSGFDEFGIPELDFTNAEVVVDVGNREGLESIRAAICGALS
jgi:hypothetical protein